MRGDPLPLEHHVLRQCRRGDLKTEADGTITGVYPDAFEPDDDGISVTWLEYFGGSPEAQLLAARDAMNRIRRLRESNRLAKLNVGSVIDASAHLGRAVAVTHDPIEEPPDRQNLGHSLITGVLAEDDDLRNRIAMAVLAGDLELAKL